MKTTLLTFGLLTSIYGVLAATPASPAPQAQESLPKMLDISWSAAPPFPQGLQDNDGGLIDRFLVMAGGFCHGYDDDWKPGKYPRGFLRKAWALDLEDESRGWQSLPDFPGAARQEMYGVSVDNEVYWWGGFNYTDPFAYRDGYKLSRVKGSWVWSELPPLILPGGAGCVAAVGSKIYLMGGMDYDSQRYYVTTDRTGEVDRYGSRFYVIDTRRLDAGWRELSACPGTPRMMQGFAALNGRIYVMGGYAVDRAGGAHNVVDSWRFDPQEDRWERLRDLPVSLSGFGSGSIVFQHRYLILPTGFPHPTILNPDESVRPRYGTPSRIDRSSWKVHPRVKGLIYENHMWVYDTRTNLYGTTSLLPYDDHGPATHVIGDTVYLFPGETGSFYWEGEYFGHAPEFVLKGKIRELAWE